MLRLRSFSVKLLMMVVICGLIAAGLSAQSGKGVINGRAVDTTGAICKASSGAAPQGLAVASDRQGEFSISDLAPGAYTITVSYVGSRPSRPS